MSQNVSSISSEAFAASQQNTGLTQENLAQLAQTYDQANQPVWIYDRQSRCVYRNHLAMCSNNHKKCLQLFDIVDHEGHAMGYLSLA
jgi:flagellar basal body rod protein FlgC